MSLHEIVYSREPERKGWSLSGVRPLEWKYRIQTEHHTANNSSRTKEKTSRLEKHQTCEKKFCERNATFLRFETGKAKETD